MTLRQLRCWLTEQLKEAEPLDRESDLQDPNHIALTAAKKLSLHGCGSGELLTRAWAVETPQECAAVLADCLAALPDDGPIDPNALCPSDVARMLGVSQDTILGWIHDHELVASNIASRVSNRPRWIIAKDALDTFLRNRQQEPQATATRRSNGSSNGSIQFY